MSENRAPKQNDRRVKRTKKTLRESLLKLLEEKPIDKITVKELTETAEINRSTFYFYYKDVVDMVAQIQDEIFRTFEEEVLAEPPHLDEMSDFIDYIRKFLDFIRNNIDICRFAVTNDVNNLLSARIRKALLENLPDTKAVFDETDPRYYITIYGMSGIWYTILEWMYDGMKVPSDTFATFLAKTYFFGGRSVVLGE